MPKISTVSPDNIPGQYYCDVGRLMDVGTLWLSGMATELPVMSQKFCNFNF